MITQDSLPNLKQQGSFWNLLQCHLQPQLSILAPKLNPEMVGS
jgi:hypothetical protein